jgi:hypothetical protein
MNIDKIWGGGGRGKNQNKIYQSINLINFYPLLKIIFKNSNVSFKISIYDNSIVFFIIIILKIAIITH